MGTNDAPNEKTLTSTNSSPENVPSTTATLLDEPINPTITVPISFHRSSTPMVVSQTNSFVSTVVSKTHPLYVEFQSGDSRNPVNFSLRKKWCITLLVCAYNGITSPATPSFAMGFNSMMQDLNCTLLQATVAYSLYSLGFGVVPLFTSAFSEEVGRKPVYLVSAFLGVLCCLVIALSDSIQIVMVALFFGGACASTGSIVAGGTIADIWEPHQRGLPMAIFSFVNMVANGLGSIISAWLELNPHLQWRWIQWIQMIVGGIYFLVILLTMEETRSQIILRHITQKLRKDTGDDRYRVRGDETRQKLSAMVKRSCTRPIMLVLTEPIVTSICIWLFFVSGVLFVQIDSVSGVFESLYGFNVGQSGLVFITVIVGSLLGLGANSYQDALYRKYVSQRGPEARLYIACLIAILLPISIFIYALTADSRIFWMWPVVGLTIFMFCAFVSYQVVFTYFAECYGPIASSALACQGLARNLGNFAFPLFSQKMFDALTYKWANILFGGMAVILIPVPFFLFYYGSWLRERSAACSQMMQDEGKSKNMNRNGEP